MHNTLYIERPPGEIDTLIYTNRVAPSHLSQLDDLKYCPTLFQEEIPKVADVRITVVDNCVHAVRLTAADVDGHQRCDIRRNNMTDVVYDPINLPDCVDFRIKSLMRHYKLRFSAVDMAIDNVGNWVFFEINPNGQWAWLDLVGATNIAASFIKVFSKNQP